MGNQKTFTFENLPTSLEELKALPGADLKEPEATAALVVTALSAYPTNKDATIEMLNFLGGPHEQSNLDIQRLADRFRGKEYIVRSFFEGATVDNNYEPTKPYQITVSENPYSRDQINEGYITLYVQSAGADSPRPIKLRNKPSTGEWFFLEQMILADIRIPKAADPWA